MSGNFELTPEQIAQSKKMGTAISSQTPIQQQSVQNVPVQQPPVQQPPVQQPPVQQQPVQQEQPPVTPTPSVAQSTPPEATDLLEGESQTYFVIEGKKSVLELDLITFREKNKETRFFTIKFHFNGDGQNQQVVDFTVDNNADFEKLKSFFAQLSWED